MSPKGVSTDNYQTKTENPATETKDGKKEPTIKPQETTTTDATQSPSKINED